MQPKMISVLYVLFCIMTAPAPQIHYPLLLTGADILDAKNENLLHGYDLLIKGNRIKQIAPSKSIRVETSIKQIDLTGLTLIPGLIDLHSHLLLHPYDEASWNDQVLKESLELRTIQINI